MKGHVYTYCIYKHMCIDTSQVQFSFQLELGLLFLTKKVDRLSLHNNDLLFWNSNSNTFSCIVTD